MKKIKKIIIGLNLGLILAFVLTLTPQKIKADNTITNLVGYSWKPNISDYYKYLSENVEISYNDVYFSLNTETTGLSEYQFDSLVVSFNFEISQYIISYNSNQPNTNPLDAFTATYDESIGDWKSETPSTTTTILFQAGSGCSNSELINWLLANGTLIYDNGKINVAYGNYYFGRTIVLFPFENIPINFSSNNENFNSIRISAPQSIMSYNNKEVYNYTSGGWLDLNNDYSTINIGNTQELDKIYWLWLKNNLYMKEPIVYYNITFDRNGATSGDLPPLQDVVSGTTFDLNNYNPGNLAKKDSTFLGWNTDASATTPLTSIVVNSDVLLYAIFSDNPKSVNIKITCRDNVVWQGNATFSNNKIVGGVSWDDPTMTNVFFESLDSHNVTLINEKYGLNPNYTSNQLLLFFRAFSTEKDESGKYLAYVNLIKITTPKGTYAVNYTSDTSPKNINFDSWLATEGLTKMLKVDSDNYYFNLEVSWSLEEPLPPGQAEWGNVATIMAKIMASATTLLNINIGFITLGNLLLIVIALSILFFVIKVWRGGN